MECGKVPARVHKVSKQVKDELDRIKHAEKKKRRLEKALATSAAIRFELEKKKQKKKEEQERLDEEGAAIAEAVALQVLLGEDSDDSCNMMLKNDEGWCRDRFDLFMGGGQQSMVQHDISRYPLGGVGLISDTHYRVGCMPNRWANSDRYLSSAPLGRDISRQYFETGHIKNAGIAGDLIAAQAVSALRIGEEMALDTYAFNQMLRG